MKRVFLLSILFSANLMQAQTIKLASDIWPPFTDKTDEVHFAQDIVVEALKRSNQSAEIIIVDFSEVIPGIDQTKYDGSAALWKSDEREEMMLFSKPYLENRLVLVGRKGSNVNYGQLSELRGKKIAIVKSYDYGPELLDLQTLIFLKGGSEQECFNMLLSGKVDYILLDNLFAHHLKEYQKNDVSKYLAIGDRPLLNKSLHFAISRKYDGGQEIIEKFNSAITSMIKDGTYNEILNISWILADIDNDGTQEVILGGANAGTTPPENIYQIMQSAPEPESTKAVNEYYVQGKEYNDWNSIPETYKLKPYNNSNNINILKLDLNKK